MASKNTICLWFDGTAEEAAQFYARTFPDSAVGAIHRAPGDYPAGKQGDVLLVEFTVIGIPCIGLNRGPEFKKRPAAAEAHWASLPPAATSRSIAKATGPPFSAIGIC